MFPLKNRSMKKNVSILRRVLLTGAMCAGLLAAQAANAAPAAQNAQVAHAESFTMTPLTQATTVESQQMGQTLGKPLQFGGTQQLNNDNFNFVIANPNTVDPKKFLFEINPGQSARDSVLVKNNCDVPLKFNLYGADETRSAQGSFALKTKSEPAMTVGKWINFDEKEFTLAPGETKRAYFSVNIPAGTPEATYSGGVAAEKTSADTKNPNVIIAVRIGIRVDVKVTSNPQPIQKKYTEVTSNPLFQAYFLASLALFIGSAILLGWTYLKGKKHRIQKGHKRRK